MRTIKFRAWNPVLKQMGKPFEPLTNAYTEGIFKEMRAKWPESFNPEEDVRFMQFTGLLDKKSVEIYEGDIVETPFGGEMGYEGDKHGHIEYVQDKAQFMIFWETGMIDEISAIGTDLIEVIGNIYDQPYLLNP